jgi:cyclohexyl-isocyanide hydratase
MTTTDVAFLVYPGMALLDLAGPFEVLHRLPSARLRLVWKDTASVMSETGAAIVPQARFAEVPSADVLCVPGGGGQIDLMEDEETLGWVRAVGERARFVTSVCTGSLVLGAAGLLGGYRATTHWASLPLLAAYGAVPVEERVVVDRNRITGAGVTAGIDFALRLAAILASDATAEAIELAIEYDPAPPFAAGHPRTARPAIVDLVRSRFSERLARRSAQAARFGGRGASASG